LVGSQVIGVDPPGKVMTATNVPAARTMLFGRDGEVDMVAKRLVEAPGRLVTVTGCGGVGKTSLALAVARQLLDQFADGVWLADLSAIRRAETVPGAVAQAVGLRGDAQPDLRVALVQFLRDRQLLLVLDNCEHLIDASAVLADAVLDSAPELRILATSREPLRISGEEVYPVATLQVPPDADADTAALTGYPAVQLLLNRATAARPDVKLTSANAPSVVEICTVLDGIPLALELAATRANSMTLEALADRLRSEIPLLVPKSHARPERQQTMRAALQWSHDLLSAAEQTVFRRLGAMAGSWTMEAAEFVCRDDDTTETVADLVSGLVDKSLVVHSTLDGESRYRLLAPIREFAAGRLAASGDSERARTRHCAFYVRQAERAEPEIHRSQQAAWVRRLDSDLDNMRAAIRTANARSDAESVLRLVGALWWYLWQRGHLREGVKWLEPALGDPDVSTHARIVGLRAAAMLHGSLGNSADAHGYASEMLDLARREGDSAQVARATMLLALEMLRRGEVTATRPYFEHALAAARAINDPMMIGHALVHLGEVVGLDEGVEAGESLQRQALAHFESTGDLWGTAYASNYLAAVARATGRHEAAAELSAGAVQLFDGLRDRFFQIFALEDLGRAVAAAGRKESAARLFGAADALRRATGALVSPLSKEGHNRAIAQITASLGLPKFESAWAAGARQPVADLVNEALTRTPNSAGPPNPPGGSGGALTRRELEVARLMANGRTNRQIAEELVITVGTAGVHVEHILRKLDLRSRHQVAGWAREHGLVTD